MAKLGERAAAKGPPASWHDAVRWRYSAGVIKGEPVLQIETARKMDTGFTGEFAQVIQIDREHAPELVELLKRTFTLQP